MRDIDARREYLKQMAALAEEKGYHEAHVRALNELGLSHRSKQDYEQAMNYYRRAFKLAQDQNIERQLPSININFAHIYWRLSKIDSAIYLYQEALKGFEKIGDKYEPWKAYVGLAQSHMELENNEQALVYLEKAHDIVKDSKNRKDRGSVLYYLAAVYKDTKAFDKYYDIVEAWEAFQNEREHDLLEIGGAGHLSLLAMFNRQNTDLIAEFELAVEYFKKQGNAYRLGWSYFDLGQAQMMQEQYGPAKESFLLALEQYEIADYQDRLSNTYQKLYQIEKKLNNFPQALAFLEQHEALKDSLGFEKMKEHIARLEVAFETEKKERLLAQQDFELRQKTTQRNIFIGSSFFLALIAFLIFFGLRNRIRLTKKIAQQEADLQDQKIRQLEQEKHLMAFNYMLEGQEKERIRIAKDLHDSLGGLMSTVKAHFNALKPKDIKPKATEIYSKTNKLIDDASVEIRRISHNMVPKALAVSGLKGSMEDLVDNLEAHGIHANLEMVNWSEEIDSSKALVIYRTIQEILNNIIKHAKAKNVLVQLIKNEDQLSIFVEDDGKGFDVKKAFEKEGLGLQNIDSRVQFLKGKIEWDSVINEGTTVSINIPVGYQQQNIFAA